MQKKTLAQLIIGIVAAAAVIVLAIFIIIPMFSAKDDGGTSGGQADSSVSDSAADSAADGAADSGVDGAADGSADGSADGNDPSADEVRKALLDVAKRDPLDRLAMGPVDAPVVISVFSDYRCPYCTMFSRDTFPEIVKEYVDSGQVRIEWRDAAFQGDESVMAATAAHAAALQNKYWEYHDALVNAGSTTGHVDMPLDMLLDLAKKVGIPDLAKFETDMKSDAVFEMVKKDYDLTIALSVQSTPTFIVGGDALLGAQPFAEFKKVIDRELELAKK